MVQANSQPSAIVAKEHEALRQKIGCFEQMTNKIDLEIVKLSHFVSQLMSKNDVVLAGLGKDVEIVNDFRVKQQELEEIRVILSQEK